MAGPGLPGADARGVMRAVELAQALGGRWHGSYGMASCPAHDDKSPSLAIRDLGGRLLVHCHAGCDQALVVDALCRRQLWPGKAIAKLARGPAAIERERAD